MSDHGDLEGASLRMPAGIGGGANDMGHANREMSRRWIADNAHRSRHRATRVDGYGTDVIDRGPGIIGARNNDVGRAARESDARRDGYITGAGDTIAAVVAHCEGYGVNSRAERAAGYRTLNDG